MTEGKQPHILNAASNLLGICFILITGLKLTKAGDTSIADDVSYFAALSLLGSCIFSYISMRSKKPGKSIGFEKVADALFMTGLLLLFAAVIAFSRGIL